LRARVGRPGRRGRIDPYVAGWGQDGALDAIREYAQTIDAIARQIEAAIDPKAERTADAIEEEEALAA
jgi:hypothetical protein